EIIRFRDSDRHPDKVTVGREDQPPPIKVRAIRWVIADDNAADGWRPLEWVDVVELLGEEARAFDRATGRGPHWLVDLDDLEGRIPSQLTDLDKKDLDPRVEAGILGDRWHN